VTFFELGEDKNSTGVIIARRSVAKVHDLSESRGLIHLRHALYYDANLNWAAERHEALDASNDWRYALEFREGEGAGLIVLFPQDFSRVGKVIGNGIDVVPSPRIAESVQQYLTDIDVLEKDAGR
jgi:hypothetical protein